LSRTFAWEKNTATVETCGREEHMGERLEMPLAQLKPPDTPVMQSTSNETIKLILKLRWMGMEDEAERVLTELTRREGPTTDSVLVTPSDTD
jgi:hypothetical protein